MKDYIIGIDHGNGYMKTVGSVFISGLDTYAVEPPMADGVLQIDGAYHVIGENRKAYDPDKTKTMDYYYLTLAAIAKEIEMRKYPRKDGSFILACGLPIEFFGKQKDAFKTYLSQKKEVHFWYSGKDYHIRIKKVVIFPQGYAVIAPRSHPMTAGTMSLMWEAEQSTFCRSSIKSPFCQSASACRWGSSPALTISRSISGCSITWSLMITVSRRCCSFGPGISRRSLQRPRRSLSVNIQKRCLLNWSRRGST